MPSRVDPPPAPALRDPLTGLLSRPEMLDRLGESVARARRSGEGLAVLAIDVGGAHPPRPTEGLSNSEALRTAAERLRRCLRAGDPLARVTGDQFVAVVHNTHKDRDLGIVARRLLEALAEPLKRPDGERQLAPHLGIALFPSDGSDADGLVRNAETAMYQAKANTGARFHFFDDGVNRSVANQLKLESSLRRAVEREELLLHYQPLVDLGHSEVTSVEALLRWQSEDGGLAEPVSFLPAAETLGLMPAVGEWTLRRAAREIAALPRRSRHGLSVSVNVSGSQLLDPRLEEVLELALQEAGLEPGRLELEIDERTLCEDLRGTKEIVTRLRSRGVRIALDAFGTGYASLTTLRRIPVDTLKIDRGFVRAVASDPTARSIVEAIVMLCARLECRAVAVGVEEQEQVDVLLDLGCQHMQGFAFFPPVSSEELARILEAPEGSARSGLKTRGRYGP